MQRNICMKFDVKFNMSCLSALSFVCLIYYPLFNGAITSLLGLNTMLGSVVMTLLIGIEALFIYGTLLCRMVRKGVLFFSTYSIVAILYMLTMLFFPENTTVLLGTVRRMVLFCIPSFLIAFCLNDFDKTWNYLCKFSFVVVFCGFLYISQENSNVTSYSMWFGYQLTIPIMVLLYNVFLPSKDKCFRLLSLLFVFAGMVMIVLWGSRGPILVLIIYSVYCIHRYFSLLNVYKRHKRLVDSFRIFVYGIISIVMFLILIDSEIIAESLNVFAQSFGFESRTLRVLAMTNGLRYVSNRDVLYNVSSILIKESPLIGYGLAGDCVQIGKFLGVDPDLYGGLYAHNFYLSLMLHFGIFVGSFFFGYFIYLMHKKLKMLNEGTHRNVFVLLLIYVSVQLMISGSYLTTPTAWLLVGIATNKLKDCKESKSRNYNVQVNL